jgi:predicted AAA+ superfamily ATPase
MHLNREKLLNKIEEEFEIHQICALLGPRQCGKTTLAKELANQSLSSVHFFDCENPLHLARLDFPLVTFQDLQGLIVIDEVQRRPDLFPILRVLVDEDKTKQFLITGSASRDLIHQSSETLAGRIGYHQVTPFSLDEVDNWNKLWLRGGFPKSYLASSSRLSIRWRDEYILTFLERDLAALGFNITPYLIGKLWRMLAHVHGQTLNYHDLSRSLDMDQRTIKRYLQILEGAFMITLLKPWHSNLSKREVRAPKIYIRDTGLLHRLLMLTDDSIENHPKLGASYEGFAIEQLLRRFNAYQDSYFWATHNGAELDLLINHEGKKLGFEIKYTDSPKITKSMHLAIEGLQLNHLFIIIPSKEYFQLSNKVTCVGIENIFSPQFNLHPSINDL